MLFRLDGVAASARELTRAGVGVLSELVNRRVFHRGSDGLTLRLVAVVDILHCDPG